MNTEQSLRVARMIDPDAESMGRDADDCLLVASDKAKAVLAAIPRSWENPNDPPTPWTRIITSSLAYLEGRADGAHLPTEREA